MLFFCEGVSISACLDVDEDGGVHLEQVFEPFGSFFVLAIMDHFELIIGEKLLDMDVG